MGIDLATLGLEVDSRGFVRATTDMDRFGDEAERTEQRATGATDRMSRGFKRMAVAIGAAVASAVSIRGIQQAVQTALPFQRALAETSTLIQGTTQEMGFLREAAMGLATTFGTGATEQVNAFYQAISAGAGSVEEANEVLEQANRLAVGGVTQIQTAVGVLSSVTNAYGRDVLTLQEVSDALFVGVKQGVTTVGELASSLGNIVPIAASVGISFDEVVSGIAALTKQGQSTATATTNLAGAIASVIRPTAQAQEVANSLGLDFSTAAIEAQGFAGFLESVIEATGGSTDAMAQLFGSLEGLRAVLALAGGGIDDFNAIMDEMATKAGSTEDAYRKMSEDLAQRWDVVVATIQTAALRISTVILSVVVPAAELFIENFDRVAVAAGVVATAIVASYVPALIRAVTSTTTLTAASVALRWALMRLPFVILLVGVTELIVQFLRLREDMGSTAEVFQAFGTVAAAVWEGIVLSAKAIPPALASVWATVEAGFARMIASLWEKWSKFLATIAGTSQNLPGVGDNVSSILMGQSAVADAAAVAAGNQARQAEHDANAAREQAAANFSAGQQKIADAMQTLKDTLSGDNKTAEDQRTASNESLAAIEAALKALEDGEDPAAAIQKVLDSIKSAGGGGGRGEGEEEGEEESPEIEATEQAVESLSSAIGGDLRKAFESLREESFRLSDALLTLVDDILTSVADAVLQKGVVDPVSNFLGSLIGGALWSAKGNAFSTAGETVTAFARGGVVSEPTMFRHAGGLGIMSEVSDEAIMPLKRSSDGSLGVVSTGGGGVLDVNVVLSEDLRGEVHAQTDEKIRVNNIRRDRTLRDRAGPAVAEYERRFR